MISSLKLGNLYEDEDKARTIGILLYGAPGVGKTMLAHAVLSELKGFANYLVVESSDLYSKYFGESQSLIDGTFAFANSISPCVIFMDEADVIMRDRSSNSDASDGLQMSQNSLLQNIDCPRVGSHPTYLLTCSNLPFKIDPAFGRRLSVKIYVGAPTLEQRKSLLQHFIGEHNSLTQREWDTLTNETSDLSISRMKSHVRQAKSKIEDEVKNAPYFVLVSTAFGPKWLPCKTEKPGYVKRENIHLSNVYPPKIKYSHVCRLQKSADQRESKSFRDRIKLKPGELLTMKKSKEDDSYSEEQYMEYANSWK